MKVCVFDFETASPADLKKVGAWRYAEDPNAEVICLSFEWDSQTVTWEPGMHIHSPGPAQQLLALILDPETLFASFGGFEKAIWRRLMVPVYGFPDIPDERWHDIQAVAAMKAMPLDLDGLLNVTGLGAKDHDGSKLTISLSKINKKTGMTLVERTPEVLQRVYAYCESDVREERSAHDYIGNFQAGERDVWLLDQRINERGIRIDLGYVEACQRIVDGATGPLAREFRDLTGGLTFTQVAKVRDWCDKQGYYIPDLTKQTLVEVLGYDIDQGGDAGDLDIPASGPDGSDGAGVRDLRKVPEHVRRALEIRQLVGSASIKKLARMRQCCGADGRARGLLQYHGSVSGRWSGRILQPQNFPRPTYKDGSGSPLSPDVIVAALSSGDWELVDAMLGPPVEMVVNGLRHALVAGKGRVFVAGDYTQVELRGLMAHAGQADKVKLLADGLSPYQDLAGQIFKRPIDKKKDPFEYDIGKHAVLGLGYQMGKGTFQRRYVPDRTEEFCEEVVQTYRREWAPEVPKHWRGLEDAALATVYSKQPHSFHGVEFRLERDWMTARLPSGRKVYFFKPEACRKVMPWRDENGDHVIKNAWSYWHMKQGVWTKDYAFGGHLTGVITQAIARDLLVFAMPKLEANGFPIVLTVHDEIVAEPLLTDADEIAFSQLMTERPQWAAAMNFPVKVDTWVSDRYRK